MAGSTVNIENVRLAGRVRRLQTRLRAANDALTDIARDPTDAQRIAHETLKLTKEP